MFREERFRLLVIGLAVVSVFSGCRGACGPVDLFSRHGDGCDDNGHFCGDCSIKRRPSVTARPASPWNQGEPCGIPFYLPKPLLVVAKNVYHIQDPKVGLTNSAPIPPVFDSQGGYADASLNSNVVRADQGGAGTISGGTTTNNVSGDVVGAGAPPYLHSTRQTAETVPAIPVAPGAGTITPDGLAPHVFYTYEIVFVPDLAQKYVLEVKGGAGEMRAALQLVNGWQFTGLGPYYMKDSSTAQNMFARGVALNLGLGGASDLVSSIAALNPGQAGKEEPGEEGAKALAKMADAFKALASSPTIQSLQKDAVDFKELKFCSLERYAEVRVFEPVLDETGRVTWHPVVQECFDREYISNATASNVLKDMSMSGQGLANMSGAFSSAANAMQQKAEQPQTAPPAASFNQFQRLPSIDSTMARDVVNATLRPVVVEKKPWWQKLAGCKNTIHKSVVEGTLPAETRETPVMNQDNVVVMPLRGE